MEDIWEILSEIDPTSLVDGYKAILKQTDFESSAGADEKRRMHVLLEKLSGLRSRLPGGTALPSGYQAIAKECDAELRLLQSFLESVSDQRLTKGKGRFEGFSMDEAALLAQTTGILLTSIDGEAEDKIQDEAEDDSPHKGEDRKLVDFLMPSLEELLEEVTGSIIDRSEVLPTLGDLRSWVLRIVDVGKKKATVKTELQDYNALDLIYETLMSFEDTAKKGIYDGLPLGDWSRVAERHHQAFEWMVIDDKWDLVCCPPSPEG